MIYKFKDGTPGHIQKCDPQAIGDRVIALGQGANHRVQVDDIIEDARDESSPLHEVFPWDDKHAAHLYRRVTARGLLRSIVVVDVEAPASEQVSTFVSVVSRGMEDGDEVGEYVLQCVTVMQVSEETLPAQEHLPPVPEPRDTPPEPDMAAQYPVAALQSRAAPKSFTERVIDPAWDGLISWLDTYGKYRSEPEFDEYFGPVVEAIEKLPLARVQVPA